MKSSSPSCLFPKWTIPVLVAAFALVAAADEQRIDLVRSGVKTSLALPIYTSQGVSYASLNDLASQLGGSVEVGDARASFKLGDQSFTAGLENDQVQAASGAIALRHPIRGYNGDALIAIEDLVPVFRASFGFGTPDAPPASSALSLESVEPGLESVETVPSISESMESDSLESVESPLANAEEVSSPVVPSTDAQPLDAPAFDSGAGFLLAVDPGHGGDDSGVVGSGGLSEKDVSLSVATQLRRILKEQYGVATVSTRENDEARTVKARRQMLATEKATLVLSIHCGANTSSQAQGPMLFAHRPAQTLSVDPKPGLGAARILAKACEGVGGEGSPLVLETPLLLLRDVPASGVLVELGNMKNPDDEARLADSAYQAQLASALAAGINQLFERPSAGERAP